ncbi:MAG: YqgE/AlgH family protein [Actinobacteria bacterium]|nr:YqgE/AlgH family protein [Actinomycetota bacterium]
MLKAGKLLVATPTILDPNFARTVVLLCNHGDEGAVGLVLNRPSDVAAADHLPEWSHLLSQPFVGFGGPVDTEAAIGLGKGSVDSDLWTPICCDIGLIDLSLSPTQIPGIEAVRVFAGYSGWGPGQLESEITEAAWFVLEPEDRDLFTSDAPGLWSRVLRRQRGDIALFANFPVDPSVN